MNLAAPFGFRLWLLSRCGQGYAGQYDVVAVCEAPDDEAAIALSLSVCSRGNVCAQTLRAFSFDEMKVILGRMV